MGGDAEKWLRTDEQLEAVLSLEGTARFVSEVDADIYAWRWTILSLHTAVQGFMVVSLRFGDGLLALKNDVAKKWLQAHRLGGRYPVERLDSFLSLYRKVKDPANLHYTDSKAFVPNGTEDGSIRRLNGLRNEFVHFLPRGWSLELAGLPSICRDCVRVVEFLAWHSGNISWHDQNLRHRVELALSGCERELGELDLKYKRSD